MNIPDPAILRKAIVIKTEIERLEHQLHELFASASSQDSAMVSMLLQKPLRGISEEANHGFKKEKSINKNNPFSAGAKRRGAVKGKAREVSPSGPLGPAILKVLKESGAPMKVAEIFEALEKNSYQWTTKNPLQMLYVRMPKLPGVIRADSGAYTLASVSEEGMQEVPVSNEETVIVMPAFHEANEEPLLLVDDSGEEQLAIIQTEEISEFPTPVSSEESCSFSPPAEPDHS